MSTLKRASVGLFFFATLLLAAQPATAQVVQEFATGLVAPIKLLAIPGGGLLVAEAGAGSNTGRVSLVDRDARRFTVIDGLPSGFHLLGPDAGGPSGLLLTSTRLYVVIGSLRSGSKVDSDPEILPVPNLHYVYSPKDSPFSFGLGVYAPFGLGVKWPKETPFRTGGIESKLSYLTINPVLAWEALPGLSLSAGPTFNYSQAQLRQGIGAVPGDIFTFRGDDWAFGFNAGVLWQPHRQWSFGLNYRSATTLDYDGHVSTKPSPPLPQRHSSSGSFDYPQIIAAGVSFRPTTNWNFEVNVDWTDWNTLNSVKFAGVASPLVLNWESSFFYEFGATRYLKNGYYVSAGYFFSEQTTTEATFTPIVPDTDLHIGSLGVGRKGERWDWAIAAQLIAGPSRTIDNHVNSTVNGRYQLWTPTLSFSLGYHF